jgi:type IV secretion system protein VirD4
MVATQSIEVPTLNNQKEALTRKVSLAIPVFKAILKRALRFFVRLWPIPLNIVSEKYFYLKVKGWFGDSEALIVYALTPLILLSVALLLKYFKKGKTLTIICAVTYTVGTFIWALKMIVQYSFDFKSLLRVLYLNWPCFSIVLTSTILSVFATFYLWRRCNYLEIFAFHKIVIVQEIRGSKLGLCFTQIKKMIEKWLRRITSGLLTLGIRWEYLLCLLPIPVVYCFFIQNWQILLLNARLDDFIGYGLRALIPLSALMVGIGLCRLKIDQGLFIISSVLINGYGLYKTLPIWFSFYMKPIIRCWPNVIKVYQKLLIALQFPGFLTIIFDIIEIILMAYAIVYFFSAFYKNFAKKPLKQSSNYGSAKFLDCRGIKKLTSEDGIVIGAIPKYTNFTNPKKIIQSIKKAGGDDLIRIKTSHTTLIAPSRSGKGTGIIIPTLLSYPGPVFVTDIKGENYSVTKRARKEKGKKVYAFDPFGITEDVGIRINPLEFLEANNKSIVDNAKTFAYLLCPTPLNVSSNTMHFKEKATDIIQCLVLYVVCSDDIKSQDKTLSKIYDLLCTEYEELIFLFKEKIANQDQLAFGTPARLANSILGTHPEERSGAFSTAKTALSFVDTPYIREATASSDILLSDITQGNLDLFVCIPPKYLESQIRLLRLLTGIVFMSMQDAGGNIGKYNLLMLLDEMPALGHMKQVIDILTYGAGYGVSLMVISQTIGLLKSVYPEWDTFFSNQLSLFFGCSDQMTAELVAKKIGRHTVEVSSTNQGTSIQQRSGNITTDSSTQNSGSSSETGRELLMAEEIQWLGDRVVLAFNRGEYPIICHRINYWERAEWLGMWDENPLHENISGIKQRYYFKDYLKIVFNTLTA